MPIYIPEHTTKVDSGKTNESLDEYPQFYGGMKGLIHAIKSRVVYPKIASKNNVTDRVVAKFTINEKGKVKNVKIVKGKWIELNDAVELALLDLPRFIPATKNGKPIKFECVIPITFAMDKNKKP